jgi:transcriptional regulator with XRE-family HTH domain
MACPDHTEGERVHDRNAGRAAPHALLITGAGQPYTAEREAGEVLMGRELPAQIRIDDPGVSRIHIRITPTSAGGWLVTDTSRNGTYVHGRRITSLPVENDIVILHLGDPHGVPIQLQPLAQESKPAGHAAAPDDAFDDGETTTQVDLGAVRAGQAVAARREELGLSQRRLADDGVVSQSVLVSFERGSHWPRPATIAKIETYLRWPAGTIASIRAGAPMPEDDATETLSPTVQIAVLVDAVDIALGGLDARVADLPNPGTPGFRQGITTMLTELRRLDRTVVDAARGSDRGLELARILSTIRAKQREFTMLAGQAPGATLGQSLAATRDVHRLDVGAVAALTGLTVQEVQSAEADQPVRGPATAALEALIGALSESPQ